MPKLVLPSVKYKKSFLEDFLANDEMQDEYTLTDIPKTEVSKKFALFIQKLKLQANGVYPKKGLVPQTVYWLVDGKNFLGKTSIRHRLNDHLRKIGGHIGYYIRSGERKKGYGNVQFRLGLQKAKCLGIKKLLVTCDECNIGSKRIIEANGGKFASRVKNAGNNCDKLRYWINLK